MLKKTMNKKGFSLVELIVVIAIMAILAAVLVPTISNQVQRADDSKTVTEISGYLDAIKNEALSAETDSELTIAMAGKAPTGRTFNYVYGTAEAVQVMNSTNTTSFTLKTVSVTFEMKTKKGASGLPGVTDATAGTYTATLDLTTGITTYAVVTP